MYKSILVIAEHAQGSLRPVTWEAIGLARQLEARCGAPIRGILLGESIDGMAQEFASTAGCDVLAVEVPGLERFHGGAYTAILEELAALQQPAMILAGHTSQAWEFAPRLAVRLNASCITGVIGLRFDRGQIVFQRPVYGGKILAEIISQTEGTIVTIQPGSFKSHETPPAQTGSIERLTRPYPPTKTTLVGTAAAAPQDRAVAEAEIIVAAGRGIGRQENLELVRSLAALFPGSAVGGSRPLCDEGWLPYAQQIGLTGATVSPKLYIACGISGTYQHLAGMRQSGFIVAINKDPRAAIFDHADVGIVADLKTFLPLVVDAAKKDCRTL